MSTPLWRRPSFRLTLVIAAFASIAWGFSQQWHNLQSEMAASARALTLNWSWLFLASVTVLATHATLVQSWRMLLAGWGGHLCYGRAVQIWTIANLGKWIPGKVWQVGVMGASSGTTTATTRSCSGSRSRPWTGR